jgi:O-antigen/teichoic acid export membrane protein
MSTLGRSAGKIGMAMLAGSALGYILTVVVGRILQPAEYATFMTFWGLLFGLGSALSPLEQEIARLSAHAQVNKGKAGLDVLRAFAVAAVVVAVIGVVLLLPGVNAKLFHGYYPLAIVVLVAGIAFAAQFAVRGLLIGRDDVTSYSWLLVVEAAVRPVVIGVLVLVGMAEMVPFGIAVGLGSFAWLIFARRSATHVDRSIHGDSWAPVTRRVLTLLLGAALTASVITGFPAMVAILAPGGDEAKLGAFYAALAVARIPLLLFAAVQALAVPMVVRLSVSQDGQRKLRRLLALGTIGGLVLAGIAAGVALLVGPWVVRLLYGQNYVVAGWAVAGLMWSAVLLAMIQLLAAVMVAGKRVGHVLLTWTVVAVSTGLTLALWPGDPLVRATIGLIAGPTLGLVVSLGLVSLAHRSSGDHQAAADDAAVAG